MKHARIAANISVIYIKEGDSFICYSPALDLVAHGDSFEDAEQAFAVSLKLYVQEVTKKGSWTKVLQEHGWKKVKKEWAPPRVIGQDYKTINIPAVA